MFTLLMRSCGAVGLTAVLFLGMSYLIRPGEAPPEPTGTDTKINILREKRQEPQSFDDLKMPSPPPSQQPPPMIMARPTPATASGGGLSILKPIVNNGSVIGTVTDNRRAIPVIRFGTDYPQRELQQGIEGWVLVEFTIDADGSVSDIQIIESEPENARGFGRAAIRSIQRWSYQPKMVDGRAVAQHHMREIFRFEIQDQQ